MAKVSRNCRLPGLRIQKIVESKTNIFDTEFIKQIPHCLVTLLKYWRSLQFKEKPDYNFIRSLFTNEKVRMFVKHDLIHQNV